MECKYCGCHAAENDMFCRECGRKIEEEAQMPENFAEITDEMPENLGEGESFGELQNLGSEALSKSRFCANCKKRLKEGAAFCNFCGASTKESNTGALKMSSNMLRAAETAASEKSSQRNSASGTRAETYTNSKDGADFTQKKKNIWVPIIIVLAAVLIIGGTVFAFLLLRGDKAEVKESRTATKHEILSDDDDFENDGKNKALTKENKENKENKDISDEKPSAKNYFENVTSSSYLPQDGDFTYIAANLIDGDIKTAWTEGVAGYGEGQWIKFSSETPKKISRICILNGYCKNTETYYKNSRVKEVLVTFDQGESLTYDVDDIYNSWTELVLPKAVETKTVTIKINSVYEGTNYKDTCISEVKFK